MSQNVIHQRTSIPVSATLDEDLDEVDDGHDGAQARHALLRPGPCRMTTTRIGQPAPTITANPTLRAIARLCRAIQTASARPTLAIKAPWTRIVATRRPAPKSSSPSDNSS